MKGDERMSIEFFIGLGVGFAIGFIFVVILLGREGRKEAKKK